MILDKSKKNLLVLKIVICIIINILKLKQLYSNKQDKSSKLIDKLTVIKDFSKITYNVITLNVVAVLMNTIPLCMKIKKTFRKD